jgi:uncharacterized protein
MRCARCLDTSLVAKDVAGVIFDACPRCGGVWLNRGEFEQLLANRQTTRAAPRYEHAPQPPYQHQPHHHSHDSSARLPVQHRRGSWLRELFD